MEVLDNNRQGLATQYETEIGIVAQLLSQGLSPLLLDQLGRTEEANAFRFTIGILAENKMLGQANKLAKELQQKKASKAPPPPKKESVKEAKTKVPPIQYNFSHIFDPGSEKNKKSPKLQGNNLEATIDSWHRAFDDPQNNQLKNDILGYEVRQEWIQLKEKLGLTQKAKTKELRRQAAIAVKRLKDAGVMGKLFQQLGQEDREELTMQLKKFDLSQKKPWVDPWSSNGFTIYPSKESYISDLENA